MARIKPYSPAQQNGSLVRNLRAAFLLSERTSVNLRSYATQTKSTIATLSDATLWTLGRLGPSITFQTINNSISVSDSSSIIPTANISIVLAWRKTDTTKRASAAFGVDQSGADAKRCGCHLPYSDGTIYWDYGGIVEGTTRLSVSGMTFGRDVWVFTVGGRGMEIWQNGILRASNSAQPTRTGDAARPFYINAGNGFLPGGGDLAEFGGMLIYHRQIAQSEIKIVSEDIAASFRNKRMPRIPKKTTVSGYTMQGSRIYSRYFNDARTFTGF